MPRSSTTSFEVSGIYAGRYLVRVRAINAAEISSGWAYSEEKTLTGKVGEPLAPLALATRSLVHGVQVSWEFPTGSGDTLRTELQYSKNQDGSAPMPLSDVAYPGKSYQQMGLSMGAEFWYRARLVDRLGNESPWTGWVQGMASDNFDDYYENLTDAIKDTVAWEETQRTISETQEGIRNTQQELEQTAEALRKEAEDQAKQVSQDIDASAKSITADVDGKISAVNKTITDEITSVNEALDSGLAQANKGVQEAKSAVADANKQIATVNKSLTDSITQVRQSVTDTAAEINATIDLEIARVSKTLADGDAALNAQIKTAENGLKQSLSQVNTTLTNAVKQETADRIADVNAKAAQAADELLAATQGIEASIESLSEAVTSGDENLARQISQIAAGTGEQFDSLEIWYFDKDAEGWTEDDNGYTPMSVTSDGWLKANNSTSTCRSPNGLTIDAHAYRFIKMRIKKVGSPTWNAKMFWIGADETGWNAGRSVVISEPEYDDKGIAILTLHDIEWRDSTTIRRFRFDFTTGQDADNYLLFDWIAVGRPAPGASTAALQDVRSTLSNALTAEAQARSTLAAQMRGSYEGSDLDKVTSGLLYQEKTARVTAISAEVKARESLQTQFNDNKAAVSGELSSLTTEQSAQASRIGGLETSLGKKADAAALTSLTQKVEQQGATLTSQGAALTSLTNRVGQTETGLAGTNEALSGLQSVVTQQGDRITSQGQSITKLTSDLGTTNAALAKKAEAAAVTALTQQVEQNGRDIRSNTDSITSLSNQLVNGQPNRWSRRLYPVQLANAGTVPSFSDVRAVAPTVVDEVADAAKLDFTSAGSYLIALYSCQVKVAADTTITLAPGARVFDDTGAIFVNGVQVAWGNASWNTVSFELKAGWNTVEFLVNQWTGQAYINLGLKLSDKVAEMYSGLGVSALANAAGVLSSNVSQIGNEVVSNSQSITQLRNALTQTDANVASKADQTALNALTGRVEKTEAGLTAANSNIVSLTAAVNAGNAAGDDYIPNPSFDPAYDRMGYDVVETTADGVPADCPFRYAVRLAGRDHVPKINNIAVTPGDVFEMSALVACGTGSADFNFYIGRATTATGGIGARASGGNTKTTSAWKRTTWRFTVPADTNFLRPFLQVNQSSPFGTVWYAADWHMRNVTAANSAQKTADATAKAVDSLTTTVSQQGDTLSSIGTRTTSLENSLRSTNDTVSKKADTTAVTQLQGTVKQQGNDIAAANSALTKLSSDLATTNVNVNKKADASAMNTLQNQVTEQGKTLSAQGDSLTQLSNSLSQTAADIDASGKMPGNLIVNGSFERGAAGFTGWSSTATVADLQVPHSGNKALKMSAGQSNLVGQEISITQGRTYRMGVWAKQDPGTTIKDAGNTKFRVADSTGLLVGSNYGPFSSGWQLVTFDWKATKTTTASFQLTTFLSAGAMYFDDFHVLDVTDEKDIAANAGAISQMNTRVTAAEGAITTQAQQLTKLSGDLAVTNAAVSKKAEQSAVTGLTTRMTSAEGKLDSQSQQLTSLQNSLTTMNTELGKKADTSAVSSLTGRVSQVENTITSQSQSITSLTSTINTIRTQGANPWVDGTFESYSDGQVLGGNGTAVVVASQKFTGDKSLKLRRDENNGGNSDKQLGTWQSVREDAKFRFEFWAMMPADQAPSSGWRTLVGIQSQNAAGQNAWQAAVTVSEASLGARDKWVKFTGIASNNGAGRTRAVVWISTRGATGYGTPGYSLYIDDLVITDVTDAKAAQDASDATASAVSGLTVRVTDAEGKITAQAQQQTALATKVDNANSRVDNMAKTLSDSQSTQASLNTSLQSQIDAQAAANIKNQTTLDNTIKSVASITSTQHTHATALEALATQQTTLTSSVGDLSASVQNTAKTVADVNGTVSSLWSMKVETVNGKNVGAGITLGSNGETSDMILYADRFSLFNRNNATAVPVMIAEGNELYIDTARIKNSSLTSTKIADGSITNAKIGNEIRSNDFVDGSRGWRIAKDGSSQFNNVIVRGAVYATDGWFQGTVYANHIEGDIGSFAINIAQHRTRKVPKATWQWFELARFRRQNFDQVINIRGGLLQTDSITINGGAKLRAGMSYAPGADGGLDPGYLSYAMLLRGTGATSGGGSMELGIELMYETGGATRLLTAQESMNVDNMSFVVPAGTGDAVLRYGCYLDRNGQMVLTILSRFDAFAARNNNVIRGSST
ncbi:DUF1983 domain-containing protein [Klebsiella pneumoniae]|nr:DUF1983 domain-containing protein [Klebsiella pneumoniae]